MLINEFVNRTGFRPDYNYYYDVIEPAYNRSTLDKDEWCRQWLENGGIQNAYDDMLLAYEHCSMMVNAMLKDMKA